MSDADPATRLRAALDLYEVGEGMLRQQIRRDRPSATTTQIDEAIADWLQQRPGAEHGDHPGPRSTRRP